MIKLPLSRNISKFLLSLAPLTSSAFGEYGTVSTLVSLTVVNGILTHTLGLLKNNFRHA